MKTTSHKLNHRSQSPQLRVGTKKKKSLASKITYKKQPFPQDIPHDAKRFLDIASVIIVALDRQQRVTLINKKGCQLIGLPSKEIIGKNWFNNFVPKTMRVDVKKEFEKLMRGEVKSVDYYENPIVTPKKGMRVIGWNNTVLRNDNGEIVGTLSSGNDITERYVAEEQLQEALQQYQSLVDNIGDGIFILDLTGRFTYVNNIILNRSGKSRKWFLERTCFDVSVPEERGRAHKYFKKVVSGQYLQPYECMRVSSKKGVAGWIEIRMRRIYKKGKVVGVHGISRDITDQKITERALNESEVRYKTILEQQTDLITRWDKNGVIRYVNPAACRYYGLKAEELIGNSYFPYLPKDALSQVKASIKRITPKHPIDTSEQRYVLPGGEVIWQQWKNRGLFDKKGRLYEIQSAGRDITERKIIEEKLRESEEKYRTLIEAANDAIILADIKTGIIIDANKRASLLLGMPIKKIIGLHQAEIHPKGKQAFYTDAFEQFARRKNGYCFTCFVSNKTAGPIPVQISGYTINLKGRKVHAGFFRDITDIKKVEEALRRDREGLKRTLGRQAAELEQIQKEMEDTKRLSEIGVLAATVAHELRNPLSVIKTATYNIKRKTKDENLSSHLANIDKKIFESNYIIRNLLNYARLKLPIFSPVSLKSILQESVENCRLKYSKKDVCVTISSKRQSLDTIEADEVQLNELFTNILDNSFQSINSSAGSVEIRLNTTGKKKKYSIEIEDNGVGIEKADLPLVFDPFFTRKAKGTGLGLAVCNQIVNLHNGKIWVESVKHQGTIVYIQLPVSKSK